MPSDKTAQSEMTDLARRAADHRTLALEADAALQSEIGYEMAAWSTIDPATLLSTSCTLTGDAEVDHQREMRVFELEWSGTEPNTFTEISQRRIPAAALSEVENVDEVRRYREFMKPMGIVDELRVVLRSDTGVWGSFTAFRSGDRQAFTRSEVVEAARSCAPIAGGFRRSFLRAAVDRTDVIDGAPGQLIVDTSGAVVATTEAAESLLDTLGEGDRVPSVIRALLAKLGATEEASATLTGSAGPISFHATRLKGDVEEIAVVVERPRPVVLAELIMRAHQLTERERQVTELVLRGRSTTQIATELEISEYTVQDHLKSIFAKVGVVTRGELTAAIYTRHYLPRRQEGAQPGPYGYFLD